MHRALTKLGAWLRRHEDGGYVEYAVIVILVIVAIASSLSASDEPPPPMEIAPQMFEIALYPEV